MNAIRRGAGAGAATEGGAGCAAGGVCWANAAALDIRTLHNTATINLVI
jgi:hypothetical protein